MHKPSTYTVFADYFQVNLDDFSHYDGGENIEYTEDDFNERVVSSNCRITIFTQRNMDCEVKVYILDEEPVLNAEMYDLIKTTWISVPSGKLVLGGCTDNIESSNIISLPAGEYDAVVTFSNLDTVSDDELDGNDYYEFFLYPRIS